jgi:hypothetical protein
MFGKGLNPASAEVPVAQVEGKSIAVNSTDFVDSGKEFSGKVAGTSGQLNPPLADPFAITRTVGLSLVAFLSILLALDLIILKKRGVFRISSHHLAHLSILGLTAATLLSSRLGEIL